jgi:N-acetylmuramoyl-L-alanine amidase
MTSWDRRLTRRHVLGGAAAVAGAGLLAGPAVVLGREPGAGGVFRRDLVALNGVSPPIGPGHRFVMAGVEWRGPATARIELRARRVGGAWSPWASGSGRGHGPDRSAPASVHTGEPIWFGPSDELQVRASVPVTGVRIRFVAAAAVASRLSAAVVSAARSPGAARAAALPLAQPILPAGAGQPPIIARSAWAGRGHPPSAGPFYGAVEFGIVHHSDNPNGYSAGDVPAMILAIYLFHRFGNGWHDIGYNFVVDAFGRTWEARAGGIDEPVIGAQAGGFNAASTGVCMLGTFAARLPSPAAMDAVERLLAWKLPLHGVPALGQVRVSAEVDAAKYSSHYAGQQVVVSRIAGHRDVDSTDCPGADLYGRLPAVRSRVDGLAGVPLELTLLASRLMVPPDTPVTLSGVLSRLGGPPVAGAPLEIQTVGGADAETTFATVTTGPDGSWTATLTPSRSLLVRALHRDPPAVVSDLVAIGLTPVMTLSLVSGSPLRVAGTIQPARRSVMLDVYRLNGPHRRLVLSRRAAVHGGRFAARLSLGRRARGRYEIVARSPADAATAAGASPPVVVTL